MDNNNQTALVALNRAKEDFALVMQEAMHLDIVNNMAGAFDAAIIVNKLEDILTPEVMKAVFMPLMNKKIGFLTDRDPNKIDKKTGRPFVPYSVDVVRTCIIDAVSMGLLPTGNQFNIISGGAYAAKNGFTAILTKLKSTIGLVYSFEFDPETTVKSSDPSYVAIPCRIPYKTNLPDLKNGIFKYVAMVKSNGETSTTDQLRGKAERKCKKAFVELLTGISLGDADTEEATYTEVSSTTSTATAAPNPAPSATQRAREILQKHTSPTSPNSPTSPTSQPSTDPMQPNLNFEGYSAAPAAKEQAQEGGQQ
ncbi:MAG: hypothetical protein SPM02_00895 [Bacteroidales bacterium]|nr:hypothetical protein [Bacteroidales bacterium]